jgi:AcrR family transcriptional regulator
LQEDSLLNTKKRSAPAATSAPDDPMNDRIIGAAFTTFMAKGYASTSMLEIATRAKISKRDLYTAFSSKQAVLLACITSRASRMRLPEDLPAPKSREMLATTLKVFGATVIREVCAPAVTAMYRFAIAEAEQSPDVAAALSASRFVNRQALEELLVRAQTAGVLGAGDPPCMMEQYFALLWGDLLIGRLLGDARAPSPAQIARRTNEATAALLKLYPGPVK